MRLLLLIAAIALCSCSTVPERNFEFNYKVNLPINTSQDIKIWIPIPQSNEVQNIQDLTIDTDLAYDIKKEKKHGNMYLLAKIAGGIKAEKVINIHFTANRKSVSSTSLNKSDASKYLASNRLVPIHGQFDSIIAANAFNSKNMKAVYNFVLDEMYYAKPKSKKESDAYYQNLPKIIKAGITKDSVVNLYKITSETGGEYTFGNGNSNYACDISVGNCTDFHSYFMSLARSMNVPARFHVGFSIPKGEEGNIGGYHCWADYSQNNKNWIPVDISEADKDASKADYYFGNLDENRLEFSKGRDLELEMYSNGKVNFFIYPLMEENGKISNNYSKEFTYKEF